MILTDSREDGRSRSEAHTSPALAIRSCLDRNHENSTRSFHLSTCVSRRGEMPISSGKRLESQCLRSSEACQILITTSPYFFKVLLRSLIIKEGIKYTHPVNTSCPLNRDLKNVLEMPYFLSKWKNDCSVPKTFHTTVQLSK